MIVSLSINCFYLLILMERNVCYLKFFPRWNLVGFPLSQTNLIITSVVALWVPEEVCAISLLGELKKIT